MLSRIRKYSRFVLQYAKPKGERLAYIGGVYGSQNLGDEALRIAAERLFSGCCLLEYPRKERLARPVTSIFPVRNGILAGGTLINQREVWLDLVVRYIPVISNFVIFGTGVAHPAFWNDRRIEWKRLLEKCRFVGVRGPLSAELLAEVNYDRVEVVGDPALVFASDEWDRGDGHTPNTIGLNIGWDRAKQWGTQAEICNEAAKLAALARAAGWKVIWHVICPMDLDITLRVAKSSQTANYIHQVFKDPMKFIDLVKSCSVFVGTRLHSVVLATCAYVPSVMLEYRPKCRDYMLSIGQSDFLTRTDEFRAEEIWEKVLHVNSRRNCFSEGLYVSMKPLRERQRVRASEVQQAMLDNTLWAGVSGPLRAI
jgi:hypothetical protein